jgi:two-component system sensor histidine kinase/response regulator
MSQAELECRFRPDGQMCFANSAYCRYFHCSSDRLASYTQPPHWAQSLPAPPHITLETLTPQHPQINHELQVRSPQGAILWQQWYNYGRFDNEGQLIEIRAVGRDITRYKLIEARLQRQIQREQALGRIVGHIRQSLNIQDVFTTLTVELRQLLGCDRVSIYRFTPDWSGYFIAESVAPGWIPLVKEGMRTIWTDTYLQDHQGGRYRHHETLAIDDIYLSGHSPCHLDILEQFQVRAYAVVPIFTQDQLWGLLSAYHNTEPRRWQPDDLHLLSHVAHPLGLALHHADLLKQFKQAKDAAEEASRAKSNFLSHMSHELRTPLNAIIGYAQFLLRDRTMTAEHHSYLNTINASGEHLLSLINDILSMAKIEAGQMTALTADFNLKASIQQLIDMLSAQAAEKGITLSVDIEADVPLYLQGDQGKLQQILLNLLGNGIKFTTAGTVSLTVSTADATLRPCPIQFTVADTGPGIDAQLAERLFEPFSQATTNRTTQDGTGLGLAISRQFAQLLNGSLVLIQSGPVGSTFQLTLPLQPIDAIAMQPRVSHQRVLGLADDQPPVRILVTEDQEASRHLMVRLLETVGFDVRSASNGADAIVQWQTWQPSLILMDLRMPILDGYQATRRIKALTTTPPIILALTASAFDEDEQVALDCGCDGFIRKPIRENELFDAIGQYIGVRYRYEDSCPAPSPPSATIADVTVMSATWIEQLYQAAIAVSNDTLHDLIGQIPLEHAALAQTLTLWVQAFRCDKIVDLVEQLRESKPTTDETHHSDCG